MGLLGAIFMELLEKKKKNVLPSRIQRGEIVWRRNLVDQRGEKNELKPKLDGNSSRA